MTNITYELVGKLCMDWYVAEIERVNARIARARARETHPCEVADHVWYEEDTGAHAHEEPCWYRTHPFEAWCDNCKYVQPYHDAFRLAAKKAQVKRWQLTRRIKQMMTNEGE